MRTQRIYAEHTATITQAKSNPNGLLEQAEGAAVAVLAHNKPRYYMVPPEVFESMVDALEIAQRGSDDKVSGFQGQFRPGHERMQVIAQSCADILRSASDAELNEFEEC
jgi:antitoxin StbD